MESYRDLNIFKKSRMLALEIHELTLALPKYELFEEGSQIRRSSKSITSLIVEGYGRRRYKADFIKYLIYAHAECDETITHLDFLFDSHSLIDSEKYLFLKEEYQFLSKSIFRYIQWVERSLLNPVNRPE